MAPPTVLLVSWCDVNRMRRHVVASALEAIAKALREGTSDDEWSVVSQSGEAASSAEAQPVVFVDQKNELRDTGAQIWFGSWRGGAEGRLNFWKVCFKRFKGHCLSRGLQGGSSFLRGFGQSQNPQLFGLLGGREILRHGESWSRHFDEAPWQEAGPGSVECQGGRRPCSCGTRRSRVVQCRTPMCSERRWWRTASFEGCGTGSKGAQPRGASCIGRWGVPQSGCSVAVQFWYEKDFCSTGSNDECLEGIKSSWVEDRVRLRSLRLSRWQQLELKEVAGGKSPWRCFTRSHLDSDSGVLPQVGRCFAGDGCEVVSAVLHYHGDEIGERSGSRAGWCPFPTLRFDKWSWTSCGAATWDLDDRVAAFFTSSPTRCNLDGLCGC